MKSILDPSFRYVPSTQTDLRKTFARVRRELARARGPQPPSRDATRAGRVVPLARAKELASR
jgi:hypothetical protein